MTTAACFVEHSVVPDVVAHPPNHMLEVGSKFGESWAGISQVRYASGIQAQLGNVLTPTQVKDVPIQLRWPGANSKAHYTLCLVGERVYRRVRHFVTDPDAPSRANPQYRECVHYLVVNIPGGDVHAGNVLVEYIGSGPPMSSGLHRYVWLVYKQQDGKQVDDSDIGHISNTTSNGRRLFRIGEFAKKHNLGDCVAGNFYQAEFDDYVPKLMAQTGRKN